jgi:hypothetical protein
MSMVPPSSRLHGRLVQPLEIGTDHAVLGRGRREVGQTPDLAIGLAPGFLRQPRLFQLAPQLGELAGAASSSPSSRWMDRTCSRR